MAMLAAPHARNTPLIRQETMECAFNLSSLHSTCNNHINFLISSTFNNDKNMCEIIKPRLTPHLAHRLHCHTLRERSASAEQIKRKKGAEVCAARSL